MYATTMIHAAPVRASSQPENDGALTIEFSKGSVTIFTGSSDLSSDLSEAISAVLEKHRLAEVEAVAA